MDVKVKRNSNGSFTTSVYRKKTGSDIYINLDSYAPYKEKVGTLHSLIQRAFNICSETTDKLKKKSNFGRMWGKYNENIIERLLKVVVTVSFKHIFVSLMLYKR